MCSRWSRSPLKGFDTSTTRRCLIIFLRGFLDCPCPCWLDSNRPRRDPSFACDDIVPLLSSLSIAKDLQRHHAYSLEDDMAIGRGDSRIARYFPRCKFAEFATYRNRHTAIISHAQRISRLPCKHIARRSRILVCGQSGVSNPFRGERDHREHTAKRCWKACPYGLHRFPIVGEGSPLPPFLDRGLREAQRLPYG